ncbi:MAG: hypothetical protein ABEJ72_05145 [Candidatus Aenigmatarchaeota archaeon]
MDATVEITPETSDRDEQGWLIFSGIKSYLEDTADAVYRLQEASNGSDIVRSLHTPYRIYTRGRRFGRFSLQDQNWDLYRTSGKYEEGAVDEERVKSELGMAEYLFPTEYRDISDSKFSEDDSDSFEGFSFDYVREVYRDIVESLPEEAIHIGHDLGRNKNMRAALVPVAFTPHKEESQEELDNSKKYETDIGSYHVDLPGIISEEGELVPGTFDAELHIDVSSDIMAVEFESGETAHELWRLAQYEQLKEQYAEMGEWDLVDALLEDDSYQKGHERTFQRLSKYHSQDASTHLDGFLNKHHVLKSSFGDPGILDLVRGMRAVSFYFGVENSGSFEDTRRHIATNRPKLKYTETLRNNNWTSAEERLLLGAPTLRELKEDVDDIGKTDLENQITWGRRIWELEHLMTVMTVANRHMRGRFFDMAPTDPITNSVPVYEASEQISQPLLAEATAATSGAAETALMATASYMVGKAGMALVTGYYEDLKERL